MLVDSWWVPWSLPLGYWIQFYPPRPLSFSMVVVVYLRDIVYLSYRTTHGTHCWLLYGFVVDLGTYIHLLGLDKSQHF